MERLYNIDNLYKAYLNVKKQSGWKQETQRFEEDFLFNLKDLSESLKNKTYEPKEPSVFEYYERGKLRLIESYKIEDRIIQSCFVNEILLPTIMPYLIYDNTASIKYRGTRLFRDRLKKNLINFSREHGDKGYILIGDFTKYFDNLEHKNFYDFLRKCHASEEIINFTKLLLKHHIITLDDITMPYNAIEMHNKKGKYTVEKSMGIGAAVAQVGGISGAYKIDNYVKIVRSMKMYGRYMDDWYIISESKEELRDILENIKRISKEEGLFLNLKKTQVVPLRHRFTLLKASYFIKNKTVVIIPDKSTFKRERKKLKVFKKKLDAKEMTKEEIKQHYKSWRGNIVKQYGVTKSLRSIDALYNELFEEKNHE